MSTDVAIPPSEPIRRELACARQRLRESLEHYFAAGAMLIQAKRSLPHGGWLPWLERYVGIGQREAQRYMKLAEHRAEIEAANPTCMSDLGLSAALKQISKPKPLALVAASDLGSGDKGNAEGQVHDPRDSSKTDASGWTAHLHHARARAIQMLRRSTQLIESSEALPASAISEALREATTSGRQALAIVDELALNFEGEDASRGRVQGPRGLRLTS